MGKQSKKKRAYERARPASHTKLSPQRRVRLVRVRGGKYKFRALRLNCGNFVWRSEQCTKKTRITDVVYHPANNEYVRTKTLTKSAIVSIDATPFKVWYRNHYNMEFNKEGTQEATFKQGVSAEEKKRIQNRQKKQKLPANLEKQLQTGKLLARVMAAPGQVGNADGYILEEEELDFYLRKMEEKKRKKKK